MLTTDIGQAWGCKPEQVLNLAAHYISGRDGNPPMNTVFEFLQVCREHQLNPALKQVAGFWSPNKGLTTFVMIDGWLTLMNRHPAYDGHEIEDVHDKDGNIVSSTITVWRKDRTRPCKLTLYLSEWRVGSSPQWQSKPRWMLHVKCIKQAARVFFNFAGLVDEFEAEEIHSVSVTEVPTQTSTTTATERAKAALTKPAEVLEAEVVDEPKPEQPAEPPESPQDAKPEPEATTDTPEPEPDVLTVKTKVFVRRKGKVRVLRTVDEMDVDDWNDAYTEAKAVIDNPDEPIEAKNHAAGVIALLEANPVSD